MSTSRALVLGSGISGLSAAWRLAAAGHPVVILEAGDRPGGMLATQSREGFRCELGPNTVILTPELRRLCATAGCEDLLRPAGVTAKRRYLVHQGRLTPLPSGPPGLLTTPLLPPSGRARLLLEPLRGSGPGPLESVSAFLGRRFGRAAGAYADVLVAGIYAGDPEELAIGEAFPSLYQLEQRYGSVLRGLRKTPREAPRQLVSYRGGFGRLAEALASDLDVRLGQRATRLAYEDREFTVETEAGEILQAERLVLALPLAESASLLHALGPTTALEHIPHAAVAVLGLGYRREQIGHPLDGFGFLVPRRERRSLLGTLFSSTLFPDCAPPEHALLTVMVGGRCRPDLLELPEEALIEQVGSELADLMEIHGPPVFQNFSLWRPGIPQPTAALAEAREQISKLESAFPGLHVLGNWLRGVGVPDCVRAGGDIPV